MQWKRPEFVATDAYALDPTGEDFEDSPRLEADVACDHVSWLLSSITGHEVDGDGDPWDITIDALAGVISIVAEVIERNAAVRFWLEQEHGWDIGSWMEYSIGVRASERHPSVVSSPDSKPAGVVIDMDKLRRTMNRVTDEADDVGDDAGTDS